MLKLLKIWKQGIQGMTAKEICVTNFFACHHLLQLIVGTTIPITVNLFKKYLTLVYCAHICN